MEQKNKVLVVVGPSGVGKDTLMAKVFERNPGKFQKAVTHTTRKMREGEVEGKSYYYVSVDEFKKLESEGGFVETNFYNNNYYGSSKKELEKAEKLDKVMYFIIDIHGAKSVHNLGIPANFIGILPPDVDTLKKRLAGRGTETQDVIDGRVKTAIEEIEEIKKDEFFTERVISGDLEASVNDLEAKIKKLYPKIFGDGEKVSCQC